MVIVIQQSRRNYVARTKSSCPYAVISQSGLQRCALPRCQCNFYCPHPEPTERADVVGHQCREYFLERFRP